MNNLTTADSSTKAFGAHRFTRLADGTCRMGAPAKLNLGLAVYPPRPDGFHDIESWFVPVSLYDTLTVRPAANFSLQMSGLCGNVTSDPKDNLVGKAAALLAAETGCQPGAAIALHKVIPAGGGLGGGSSDCAAALILLNYLWNTNLPVEALEQLAARLGSDVPFFVRGTSAVCRGRGEQIAPLPLHAWIHAVLFFPPMGVATKEVYQQFDRQLPPAGRPPVNWQALADGAVADLDSGIFNDLQAPAFIVEPRLRQVSDQLASLTGRRIHMTGSGSTLFAFAQSADDAAALRDLIRQTADTLCTAACVRVYRTGEFP